MKASNNINILLKENLSVARDKTNLNKTVTAFPLELFE